MMSQHRWVLTLFSALLAGGFAPARAVADHALPAEALFAGLAGAPAAAGIAPAGAGAPAPATTTPPASNASTSSAFSAVSAPSAPSASSAPSAVSAPSASSAPSPSETTSPDASPTTLAAAELQADDQLAERLKSLGATPAGQTRACLSIAWNPDEPQGLRAAAIRRLRAGDARTLVEGLMTDLPSAPAHEKIGMMELMGDMYAGVGGVNSSLNDLLAQQIRSSDPNVAGAAIQVCARAGIPNAYLPLREIASKPDSPLRLQAIQAIGQITDPRAVGFLKKLLDDQGVPRDAIYRALGEIGRPAAVVLKMKLEDPDPAERRRALDALLPIANADDLSALYAYIQKYPPEGAAKAQIYDAIATIETKASDRPLGVGN
jgi:hypothetical protein